MPRLNHKKARTGCQRCKARKVKCDEIKPRCSACARHNVPCDYVYTPSTNVEPLGTSSSDGPYYAYTQQPDSNAQDSNSALELRLMHEWTAYTCKTLSTAWEFWCYQAPLIALDFRYLLDAIMAVAALHASRQPPALWNPIKGCMVPVTQPIADSADPGENASLHWKDLHNQSTLDSVVNALNESRDRAHLGPERSHRMLTASRAYFGKAIDGFRRAVDALTADNAEAVFITSVLISFNALFSLSDSGDDTAEPTLDASFWLRLGRGSYHIIQRWRGLVGEGWIASSGVYYGEPDLTDDEYLFAPEHAQPFEKLLSFGENFEVITEADRDAYQKTLAYIGTIYKGIVERTDVPLATCRRVSALPSRCPPRFVDLAEARQPRAMVMLAHVFASMKLVEEDAIWFSGVAELQVPKIYEQVPVAWRETMVWPVAVAQGNINRRPDQTQIDGKMLL